MGNKLSEKKLFGFLAAGMSICCGIPLLISAGLITGVGLSLQNWLLVGLGIIILGLIFRLRTGKKANDFDNSSESSPLETETLEEPVSK